MYIQWNTFSIDLKQLHVFLLNLMHVVEWCLHCNRKDNLSEAVSNLLYGIQIICSKIFVFSKPVTEQGCGFCLPVFFFFLIIFQDRRQQIGQSVPYYNFQLWEEHYYQNFWPLNICVVLLSTKVRDFRSLTLNIVTNFYWNGNFSCLELMVLYRTLI